MTDALLYAVAGIAAFLLLWAAGMSFLRLIGELRALFKRGDQA